ncbi:MAG: VWA domain-containing protein [Phycisphaerae bacterium]|nr:VWA domain-containing protein [Phycisphaerae bacterium]
MGSILEWILNLPSGKLGGGDWRFALTSELGNYVKLSLFAAAVGLIWLTVHCYRREGLGSRRTKIVLAAIRITVILLVLGILLQPAVVLKISQTLYSTVLVITDNSRSMSFKDRYASPEESANRAALCKSLDVSPQQLAEMSRLDIIRAQLQKSGSVLGGLSEDHPIEIISFSTNAPDKDPYTSVIDSLARGSVAKNTDDANVQKTLALLQGNGYETNLAAAIRDSLDRFQGRRLGGIVILSDGQPAGNAADPDERLAAAIEYAKQRSVPRYAVLVGDPTPPRNLSVLALRTPREIRTKVRTTFTVMLGHRNMENKTVDVRIYRRKAEERWPTDFAKRKPIASQTVKLIDPKTQAPGDSPGVQSVKINLKPTKDDLGEYVYRAMVVKQDDERTGEDNHADAVVKLTDNKIRILLVSGDAGWEFQYIRNYFLRQPDLYRLSVWQQNADAEINQSASTGMKLTRLPKSLKELIDTSKDGDESTTRPTTKPTATTKPSSTSKPTTTSVTGKDETIPPGYDVVILYDPSPTKDGFDKNFIKLLHEYVTVHRGGLCYIASNKHTFDVLRDPAAKGLSDLLPVVVARNDIDVARIIRESQPKGWPVKLTSYGYNHPLTSLGGSDDRNKRIWSLLPGIYWSHAVARKKPLARVLVEHSDPNKKMKSQHGSVPLVAVHSAGSGRVAYVGFDETWRWRFVDDGFYHRRFWGNMARYLAPSSPRQVIIATGGDKFSAGARIPVEIEAYDRDYRPLDDKTFTIVMIDTKTGKKTQHIAKNVAGKPGRYKTSILAAHTGSYTITCDKKIADSKRVASKQIEITLPQAESKRTEANERTMQTIASKKTHYLPVSKIDQLAELIPAGRLQTVEDEKYTLWDTSTMLWIIIALLSIEWFLRKRKNMA